MINAYLTDTATLLSPAPVGDWMEAPAPVETEIKCRIEYKNKRVVSVTGEEITSKMNILVPDSYLVNFDDKFRIDGVEHAILAVDMHRDFTSRYYQVFLS